MSTGTHDDATLRVTSDAASGPNVAGLSGTGVAVVPPPPPASPPPAPPPTIEAPSNKFAFPKLHVRRTGTVTARVKLPGPGKLAALQTIKAATATRASLNPGAGRIVIARASRSATKAGKLTIRLRLNKRGRQALRDRHGRLRAKLTLRFKPTGGPSRTKSRTFTLKVAVR